MPIRRILVPLDFSPRARQVLTYAFDLAASNGASVEVLHVVPGPRQAEYAMGAWLGRPMPQAEPAVLASARAELGRLVDGVAHPGVTVRVLVDSGDAAAVIVRTVAELPIDLVVMATRGHRGVAELLLGSTTHKVITCARCPVLTLRP